MNGGRRSLQARCGFASETGKRPNNQDFGAWRESGRGLVAAVADGVGGHKGGRGAVTRAMGFEASLKLDHMTLSLSQHDRFLLCTDGAHGALSDAALAQILGQHQPPDETGRAVVAAALARGASDNVTALVIDVVDLAPADADELAEIAAALPIPPLPKAGDVVDGLKLEVVISDGRSSRLFRATRAEGGPPLAVKFPHPRADGRLALVREAWVAARARSRFVGEVIKQPPGLQSRLYAVMPFYEGETLERRLSRGGLELPEGVAIAGGIARALDALRRIGVTHRDVKPDNVILLAGGGLKLIVLGVAAEDGLTESPEPDTPGTPSYMAPEIFAGARGDAASDLYALGVTVYRMYARGYPNGEIEQFQRPRFEEYRPLSRERTDLLAWLDAAVAKAVAVRPVQRYGDALEFAFELETGLRLAAPRPRRPTPLSERDPVKVWKGAALLLALALALLLLRDGLRGF